MTSRPGTVAPPVPVVLVRLKLRLMKNRGRQRGSGFAIALAAIGSTFLGVAGFSIAIAIAHDNDPRVSRAFVVLGANAVVIGWAFLPLLTFGTDETLDPARLQLFPLLRRPLITGLLAASFVGYAPFAVLLTMVGVIIGYAAIPGVVVTLAAVALLVLLAATCARTLSTALAASITSRRGRDIVVAITAFLLVAVQFIRFIHFVNVDNAFLDRASNIGRWLPPGALGQAIIDARDGQLARAFVELIPALIAVPLLLALWARMLERSLTVVTGGSTSVRASRSHRPSTLFPRGIPFLRRNAWGAVAAKELRYSVRDPRRRIVFAQLLIIGVGGPLWFAITADSLSPGSVLLASFAGYLALVGALNQFGFDGGAFWIDVVSGNRVRSELIGKNVALAFQVLPVVLIGSVILASVSGGWIYIPAALVIAAAGLGAGLAVANVMSVRYPQRVAETKSPFGGNASGQGCVTTIMLFVGMIIQGLLLIPVAVAAGVTAAQWPAGLVIVAPLCALYGYTLWRGGVAMAERWAWWRQPEILLAIDPRRGG